MIKIELNEMELAELRRGLRVSIAKEQELVSEGCKMGVRLARLTALYTKLINADVEEVCTEL